MSTGKVSDAFAAFESRNNHKLADARKEEKQSRGNPLPVGFVGTGVISDARADVAKGSGHPYGTVEVTVVNHPSFEGKTCTGAIRIFKDTDKQTKEEAYANFLDDLEDMGLSRETRESSDLAGCFKELLATPHYVSITVTENTYTQDKKQVKCYAVPSPDGSGRAATADSVASVEDSDDKYKDCDKVMYLEKPHYVVKDNEDGTYDLVSCKTKKERQDIPADDCSPYTEE